MFQFQSEKALSILESFASHPGDDRLQFRVHYWGINPMHYDNHLHKHSFYEICYVIDGSGRYLDDGHWFALEPGTLFCSRPGIWHQIRSDAGMYLLFVAFEPDSAHSDPQALRMYQTLHTTDRFLLHQANHTSTALLWQALMRQLEAPHPLWKETLSPMALALIVSFCSTFRKPDEDMRTIPPIKTDARLLKRACVFIIDNISQPLPLDSIARYLNISGRHLSRLFSEKLGISYIGYVQRERVRHAAELLAYTDISILEAAEKTGFNSVHYFTRVFAKQTGLPPGEYRQLHRSTLDPR
ncbi:AraC family transcriptional regulator [Paenibacillus piri]|nr:AraC family transcriptional regulator [Paenibacillus piri]